MPDTTKYIVRDNKGRTYDIYKNRMSGISVVKGPGSLNYKDIIISEKVFKREIDNSTFYFNRKDKSLLVKERVLPAKPFKKTKPHKTLIDKSNFMTIDIETLAKNGSHKPFLIYGYSNGRFIESLCENGDDPIAIENMFDDFIEQLKTFKDVEFIYAHNFSGFDGIFLFKHLLRHKNGVADPILFKEKLIGIKYKVKIISDTGKVTSKTYIFKDSYLLLNFSLRELCKAFGVTDPKTYFPFNITDINYESETFPGFNLYTNIDRKTYDTLQRNFTKPYWNFKEEALEYCRLDCLALYQVIDKFNSIAFEQYELNPHKCLTISSYAAKIYASKFLQDDTLYQITGKAEEEMREAFTGGAVDVYIPHNLVPGQMKPGDFPARVLRTQSPKDARVAKQISKFRHDEVDATHHEKLYTYDFNSLYPYCMSVQAMPVGKPIYFEGDIREVLPDAFGIFNCDIETPEQLQHPILQRKVKTADGMRTIAGLGKWTGWITSIELDRCLELGYKFKINRGYRFRQQVIYKDFIEYVYAIRQKYPKSDPRNLIAKLIMNSVYGRLGMNSQQPKTDVIDLSKNNDRIKLKRLLDSSDSNYIDTLKVAPHLKRRYKITGITPIEKHLLFITYIPLFNMMDESPYAAYGSNVNIAAAAIITAAARVHMSKFKNLPDTRLYYSDTDSLIVNKPIDDKYISNKLGDLKLENVMHRAVFIAPKVYGYTTLDDLGDKETFHVKIKGLSQNKVKEYINNKELTYDKMFKLLAPESFMEFSQEKWFKDLEEGKVYVQDALYQLRVTTNKRKPVYKQYKGLFYPIYSDTVPYNFDDLANNYGEINNNVQKESVDTDNIGELLKPFIERVEMFENNNNINS